MANLEEEFHRAMLGVYERAKEACHYNAMYFLRMVTEHGGLRAARRLLATAKPSKGFAKLWECGRLDISMEALVAFEPKFALLFTEAEREIARNRLAQYGYSPEVE
jgi:hypothetical protein